MTGNWWTRLRHWLGFHDKDVTELVSVGDRMIMVCPTCRRMVRYY